MKEIIGIFGGLVYVAAFCWYAVGVWRYGGKGVSPASVLMWTIIDVIFLFATIDADKPIWLPLAYVVGTGASLVALLVKGTWSWSYRETLSAVGATIALYVWQTVGSDWGLFACMMALLFAGTPIFIDQVKSPVRSTWPMWAATAFVCCCTLLVSDWSFAGTVVAWGGVCYNVPLTLVVLRRK